MQELSFLCAPVFTKGNESIFALGLQLQLKISKHCMNANDLTTITGKFINQETDMRYIKKE